MAEAKQGGAGIFAKNVQKRLSRAQEKVLQKLGRTIETKDELFEQCSYNFNQQQNEGNKLYKDLKTVFSSVKAMHESSKRLSETLHTIYRADWDGYNDLKGIVENDDLLWNDYEEKLSDQAVHIMENYISQFPEMKDKVAKRGRKLVDYDSARHHLEALQNAKKKDEAKITKAEEEFNKSQLIFEELNKELRDELPVLYSSRIGCYITIFKNISNLRDVFFKEMSKLNHDLYDVMSKLDKQHSNTVFVIKGVKSKRNSLIISSPMKCTNSFFMASVDAGVSISANQSDSMDQKHDNSSISSDNSETQNSVSEDVNRSEVPTDSIQDHIQAERKVSVTDQKQSIEDTDRPLNGSTAGAAVDTDLKCTAESNNDGLEDEPKENNGKITDDTSKDAAKAEYKEIENDPLKETVRRGSKEYPHMNSGDTVKKEAEDAEETILERSEKDVSKDPQEVSEDEIQRNTEETTVNDLENSGVNSTQQNPKDKTNCISVCTIQNTGDSSDTVNRDSKDTTEELPENVSCGDKGGITEKSSDHTIGEDSILETLKHSKDKCEADYPDENVTNKIPCSCSKVGTNSEGTADQLSGVSLNLPKADEGRASENVQSPEQSKIVSDASITTQKRDADNNLEVESTQQSIEIDSSASTDVDQKAVQENEELSIADHDERL